MHKFFQTLLWVCICTMFLVQTNAQKNNYDTARLFTVLELQQDFRFLRTKLEQVHPNLYLYTPKELFDHYFDSLYQTIDHPMQETAFYNTICLLHANLKDGHTMFLPGDAATNFYRKQGLFFPFGITILNNRLYTTMNWSSDSSITDGSEITALNGIGTQTILHELLKRQIRDGANTTYPLWIVNTYFKEYFSFTYGHPSAYAISYTTPGIAGLQHKTVSASSKDSIRYFKQKRYPAAMADNKGLTLLINQQRSTAIITIPSFDNEIIQGVYHQQFKKYADSFFNTIQSNQISDLILDIRNNQGGDFENGQYLVSRLLDTPYHYLVSGEASALQQPAKNVFTKSLYVLINGGSFSNTGILAACLKRHNRGIFIGEETGGNKNNISGNALSIRLPNTRINCDISTTNYPIQIAERNDAHGTFPDYTITPVIKDILSSTDKALEKALELISH